GSEIRLPCFYGSLLSFLKTPTPSKINKLPSPESPPPAAVTSMLPILSFHTPPPPPLFLFSPSPSFFPPLSRFKSSSPLPPYHLAVHSLPKNSSSQFSADQSAQPRTLFPGGYKRPEIKVPSIVLQLRPDEVLNGGDDALDLIDRAVSRWAGIVVLNGDDGGGKSLYEAACLLKSVVRDRAYLLIAERVDIASAVNASGVVVSDQGLPAIVARSMMMESKSESVILPLVAKIVETPKSAVDGASSEGADFLILSSGNEDTFDSEFDSGFQSVKIPIFVGYASNAESAPLMIKSRPSGYVMSLDDLRLVSDDSLSQLFQSVSTLEQKTQNEVANLNKYNELNFESGVNGRDTVAGFVRLEDKGKRLVEKEKSVLSDAIDIIKKAVPMMEEISLLVDAVSQIDEPFLLAIVGEFNSGKSSVINALLGKKYLKDGVIPTTNEITFLCYSSFDAEEQQRCERHPDGQFICYLPAPILKEMNIVDTPGTNVILQRQQRLTEEFVPRADLLLFVISADRPLTESEVTFLRYTQQWKKKIVFVLNKSDLYRNDSELEEALSFIKENTRKLLNSESVTVYPVSARSALEAKLSTLDLASIHTESQWGTGKFYELEKFLYSFLDGTTRTGMERMRLKLETPIRIAERLLSACDASVKQDCRLARQDVAYATEIVDSLKEYTAKMENESISWRRKALSLIDVTKIRVLDLIESTLQISNLDLVGSYVFKEKSAMPSSLKIQNEIMSPALSDAQELLEEYQTWLRSNSSRKAKLYRESFDKRWPSIIDRNTQMQLDAVESLMKVNHSSSTMLENLSVIGASKLFEQEIRESFLGTFGGVGAAGLMASLLTSVLPTTLEDLLALGVCSAGGYIAILNFPARRRAMMDKVNKIADGLALEVEEAMQKDLSETLGNLDNFVKTIGKPYQDEAQEKLDKLLEVQSEVSNVDNKIRTLQVEIQNLHVSDII
ncbi:Probable transmembrane GTPase FZO-like, chloroplastic, partial [Linum perenne]